jgi:putative ABC transport system permease protein
LSGRRVYIKPIVREIRLSLGRFIALFGITALGVGFLAGLLAVTPDMKISMARYFDEREMMDLFIKGTLGFGEEDLKAVKELGGVKEVMGARVIDTLLRTDLGERLVTRVYSLPLERMNEGGFINRMDLVEGRLPRGDTECLVQEGGGFLAVLKPGARLTLDEGEEESSFSVGEFTVTGVVRSPLFISMEREPSPEGHGRLSAVIYTPEGSSAVGAYTDLFVTLKDTASISFTAPYRERVDSAAKALEELGRARSPLRREEILAEVRLRAGEDLEKAGEDYEAGRQRARRELGEAREKLDRGWAEWEAGAAELEEGRERVRQGRLDLEGEEKKLADTFSRQELLIKEGEDAIAAAKETLMENKGLLDSLKEEVEKTRKSRFRLLFAKAREGIARYDAGVKAWEEGRLLLAEKEAELVQGREALEEGKVLAAAEFKNARTELEKAETEIAAGRRRLEDSRVELEEGETQWSAARAEAEESLRSGADQIEAGWKQLEELEIEAPQWYVLDRNANVGCVSYRMNSEKIEDVAKVFPVFFLLVAALVALTTMTRMVEEERSQIGTYKALGYRKRAIAGKYLVYGGLVSILGSAAGMIAGFQLIPVIIYQAFATRSHLPPLITLFDWRFGLISCAGALLCVLGTTVYSSYRTLREKPAALMRPRAPKPGKRIFLEYITPLWRAMKFTHKVTARNLLRYKKHFFMTVTGIAGCTALMVTGFGLRDSIIDIARTQFEEILNYDLRIELEDEEMGEELRGILEGMSRGKGGWMRLHSEAGTLRGTETDLGTTIYVPEDGEVLGDFITLRKRKNREPLLFSDSSVLLPEKMAGALNLKPGDPFILENSRGHTGTFILDGLTENYVGTSLYIGKEAWERVFGPPGGYGTLLVKGGPSQGAGQDYLMEEILACEGVAEAEFTEAFQSTFTSLLASISFVVVVIIFAAGALAGIVLYNLTNININERSRELATLRVLGFHHREAAAYIFREISVLSVFGAAGGLLLGFPLHRFVIGVAENVDLMFGRRISPLSLVLSGIITLVFSGIVDIFMAKKIRHIKMADSMKAVD